MSIHEMSAIELAEALRRGDVSAVEVTDHTIKRAEGIGATVGAFAHITADYARKQAAEADERLAAGRRDGEQLPPFLGVPVPIKDLNQVAGLPVEYGSAVTKGMVAEVTDGVVEKLQAAGTVTAGKTTCPEFGFPAYTEPSGGPSARTPWDLSRTAGGSSGGAAAAVAAGIVPVAHANDGGGSIRIPASCCGLVGLKPSRAVISAGPYGSDGPGLVTQGVVSRTVRDTAAFLDVMAEPRPGDSFSPARDRLREEAGSYLAACEHGRSLKVGLLLEPLNMDDAPIHPEARAAAEHAVEVLESLGHEVSDAPRPMTGADWDVFMPLWSASAAQIPVPNEAEGMLKPLTRWLRDQGKQFTAVDYANSLGAMQLLARRIAKAWQQFDVILTPTLAQPPLPPSELELPDPADDWVAQKAFTPWGSVWNMTGNASISLPLYRAVVDGVELPFGVMFGATAGGGDATLLALAAQLEAADPWPLWRVRQRLR